jgi:predicted enzyme related to lactoylglutathione lyase
MKRNAVGWFEIYVNDMSRAQKFYERVFNRKLEKLPVTFEGLEMMTFVGDPDAGGSAGALCKMEGFEAGGNSTLVYFSCLDCAIEESHVVPAGGKIFKPKMPIGPYGFISLVMDTEGNMIGLHSMQ